MILAYRKKTKCKQYVFDSVAETFQYFDKKCYDYELIKIVEYSDKTNREINDFSFRVQYSKRKPWTIKQLRTAAESKTSYIDKIKNYYGTE